MRAAMYQKYWTAAPAAAARSRALRLAAAGLIAATLGLSPLTAAGAAPRLSLVINSAVT